MALIKDGLWGIVNETKEDPRTTQAEAHRKFVAHKDRGLATIVLSIEPSLLYLLGANPEDPVVVWTKLRDHFQKKTWANRLELRRKLYALRLKEGESVQEHIRKMFESLSIMDDPVSDEDRVVHLLASLPDSYGMLVTALEANSETVPKMEVITERLLHEEQKQKEKGEANEERKALAVKQNSKKGPVCHFCGKSGHIKRECWKLDAKKRASESSSNLKHAKNQVMERRSRQDDDEATQSECEALVVMLSQLPPRRCGSSTPGLHATCVTSVPNHSHFVNNIDV